MATRQLYIDGYLMGNVLGSSGGQSSGGHTIWNAIKTALTQRTKLWFADAKVTDDSTEQATKVEVVQLIDDEDELDDAPDGVYQGDYEDAPEDVLDASMVAYNDGSVKDALDNVAYTNVYNSFTKNQGINRADGTSSTVGNSDFYLGNATASGTDGNSRGRIIMYGGGAKYTVLETVVSGTNKLIEFPNASGTIALTSDVDPLKVQEINPKASALGLTLNVHRRGYVYMLEISGSPTQALEPGNFYSLGSVSQLSGSAAALVDYVSLIEFNSSAIIRFWFDSNIYISTNVTIPSGAAFRAFGTFVIP